jgi:hypothetical protein
MQHALRGIVARSFEGRGMERRWGLRRVGEGGLSRVRREEDEDGSRVTRQEGSGRCGWASREGERLDEKLFFVRRVWAVWGAAVLRTWARGL